MTVTDMEAVQLFTYKSALNHQKMPGLLWKNYLMMLAIHMHASFRSMRVRGSKSPWMSDEIRQSIKSRDAMKRKAVKNKSDQNWNSYKRLRNNVTRLIEVGQT